MNHILQRIVLNTNEIDLVGRNDMSQKYFFFIIILYIIHLNQFFLTSEILVAQFDI